MDMDLHCWGSGELGQTGHGSPGHLGPEEAHLREFTKARLGRVKLLACGSSHSIVVTAPGIVLVLADNKGDKCNAYLDNKVFAWGNGTSGQLGDGERAVKDQPVEVKLQQELNVKGSDADVDLVNIVGVACGSRHSFIWTEAGQGYSFGNNFYAQLGYDVQKLDFKDHQLAPRLFQNLPSPLKISQVSCGERHTLFGLEDGSVAACGQNDYGQIGSGSKENVFVPCFVEFVDRVSKVTCGANHNLALTGDGRLFQWGCGRACGNLKRNILLPEEVTPPSLPLRDIAGGCWHSLLLTDGGNVFSWGMGQEGQLGLGDDRIHISTPCLLNYSQLAEVTQIQAGDSYSAAVTAGGELLLWGRIPCVSRVIDHPGLKKIWTPQPVSLASRKSHSIQRNPKILLQVCDVACGTLHMMALTTKSREKNRECVHSETEAGFRDLVSDPFLMEHTGKENTVQDSRHLLRRLERREGSKDQKKEEESESAEEEEILEEKPHQVGGDEALHDSEFAVSRSSTGMDERGNDHSSVKSDHGDERERWRTARQWELRKEPWRSRGSRDIVFTTLHLLPRSEPSRPTATTLPRLMTGQQVHSRALDEAWKERSTHLIELVPKCESDPNFGPMPRPKPRPPGSCTGPPDQSVASCPHSKIRQLIDLKSPIYNSSLHLSPGQQAQMSSPSFPPGPRVGTSLPPTPSSSELFQYYPTHRRVVSSSSTPQKNP
ncbi:probable E3 ubiquitin-protein ligase HERC1 isoform X3 [Cyclopterus lumpus]|uniref:probable E3 ubiquitin-protein ligase HERC1 isoform X3 n=1 Tax=Cyclopterus lumpus TaxID=8103 RepID=UPI00148712F8|nr:probable E3 ubiquitin-protein ligase HERC1 isoform X3 [Cyclopterus lumpus]